MDKIKIINQVMDCGVVAVIRADGEEQALKISEQCAKAGILALEITFTVPVKYITKEYNYESFTTSESKI